MSLWRVKVNCWYRERPRAAPACVRRTMLVSIDASQEFVAESAAAFSAAETHAQTKAPFGPKWLGFEAVEGSRVTLPLEVGTMHRRPHRTRPKAR